MLRRGGAFELPFVGECFFDGIKRMGRGNGEPPMDAYDAHGMRI